MTVQEASFPVWREKSRCGQPVQSGANIIVIIVEDGHFIIYIIYAGKGGDRGCILSRFLLWNSNLSASEGGESWPLRGGDRRLFVG